jgi:molybdenum cofactor synthesis domain-containing protein
MIKTLIIVLSDRGSKGERVDESGEILKEFLIEEGFDIRDKLIIPDEKDILRKVFTDNINNFDFIITSGGTGITDRDITPDITLEFIDKRITGFEYAMVANGLKKTPMASISRAVAGLSGKTLIINLPGNPKSIKENFFPLIKAVKHIMQKIKEQNRDCQEQLKEL